MPKLVLAAWAVGARAVFASIGLTAASKDELLEDEKHFYEQSQRTYEGGSKAGSALNMEVVGHDNLGARGFAT